MNAAYKLRIRQTFKICRKNMTFDPRTQWSQRKAASCCLVVNFSVVRKCRPLIFCHVIFLLLVGIASKYIYIYSMYIYIYISLKEKTIRWLVKVTLKYSLQVHGLTWQRWLPIMLVIFTLILKVSKQGNCMFFFFPVKRVYIIYNYT